MVYDSYGNHRSNHKIRRDSMNREDVNNLLENIAKEFAKYPLDKYLGSTVADRIRGHKL